jgi:hypothetical protein
MSLDAGSSIEHTVSCPHCKKEFAAQLIPGKRTRGFKCPHCRLFVPLERADLPQVAGQSPATRYKPGDAPLARDPDA